MKRLFRRYENALRLLFGLSMGMLCTCRSLAATNDVTGLTPTLTVTFDASAVANVNGSGSMTVNTEGTATYLTSPNGKAIDMSLFTPYGNLTSVTVSSNDFTVSAFATLGTTYQGLMFHLRDDEGGTKGGLVVRRGTNANEVVVTVGLSTTPVISVRNVDWGDTVYHHYALVVVSNGISLYIDGTQRASTTSTSWALAKKYYQFGSRHGGINAGESKYGGKMDDFRIYGAALTAAQIQSLSVSLTTAGIDSGAISIKTGTRSDLASDGNVSTFSSLSVLGPVSLSATTWNKTPNGTTATACAITNLQNSTGVISGMKMYYAALNTYSGMGPSTLPNSVLTKTYLDDGIAPTYTINESGTSVVLPDPGVTRGWEVMLTNIPYQHADLYVIVASDQAAATCAICPVWVKVGDAAWTNYYGMPGIGRTQPGNQAWAGSPYSAGPINAGDHYLKIPLSNLTTNTAVAIAHGARNTTAGSGFRRIGLAGLQLVRRDSAYVPSDPFYLRTVTGSANWSDAVWTHAGTSMNAWSNSTTAWKTTALLTTSGNTGMTLPDAGVTAEAVSVGGSGPFSLSGSGALAFNGDAVLDVCGMTATDVVAIAAAVQGTNVTLAANNVAAAGTGYTVLSSAANDFDVLTVRRGALNVRSSLPSDASVALSGGALIFTESGAFSLPIAVSGESAIRVQPSLSGEVASVLSGIGSLTKCGSGSLTLSGGGTFGDLYWNNTGTVSLSGTTPFSFGNTAGNGYATSLGVSAPVTLSGVLSLGTVSFPVGTGVSVAAGAVRWADNGAFTTAVAQTGGRLAVLGNNSAVASSASVIFGSSASGVSTYSLSGGDFLATNAVAMLSWQGGATWAIGGTGHAYVKGIDMKGSVSSNSDCYAALTLSGGTLEIGDGGVFAAVTTRPRTIGLSTGIVRAWSNFTFAASAVSTSVTLGDAATGVTLDPNGKTVAWYAPLSGPGKLVLNDASASPGRLRLLAANTHSGGIDVQSGTLELGLAGSLGTGPLTLYGGRLDIGTVDASCAALIVTNTAVLSVRVGIEADYSGSGALIASSVALNNTAANTLAVVIDLNGLATPVAEYPILLSPSLPSDALSKMTVAVTNGASLPAGATVSLAKHADGIYAVFSGVTSPRNLFWRNGVTSGDWSEDASDTPWSAQSVDGASTCYTNLDTVNFTDIAQAAAIVNVQGTLTPVAMNVNNTNTTYSFVADAGGGLLRMPSVGFTKTGSGTAAVAVPMLITNATLTVDSGTLQINAALGTVSTMTLASPLVVSSNAVAAFGYVGNTQTIAGVFSGAGTLRTSGGRLKIASSGASFSGKVVAAGGVLELAGQSAFLNSSADLRVEAGSTMEVTALDASGYNVTNTKPIEVAGTLKLLQRDSTARGIKLYDGGVVLMKGSGMDSGHAMDLFNQPSISLVSGTAFLSPLDPTNAAQATIIVRTEHPVKTFDVQSSNAVLTVETPLFGGATGNTIDKIGPGTLLWTGTNTTVAKLRASAGTFAIGGTGALSAGGTTAQVLEILSGATFRYASSASQTLSGAITCSGTFAKAGAGRLAITGAFALNAGGVLAVPGTDASADAVKVNSLSLNGGAIRASNADTLRAGKTYTLLTSDSTLPSGILGTVAGLGEYWRITLSSDGKAILLYKPTGTLLLMN